MSFPVRPVNCKKSENLRTGIKAWRGNLTIYKPSYHRNKKKKNRTEEKQNPCWHNVQPRWKVAAKN